MAAARHKSSSSQPLFSEFTESEPRAADSADSANRPAPTAAAEPAPNDPLTTDQREISRDTETDPSNAVTDAKTPEKPAPSATVAVEPAVVFSPSSADAAARDEAPGPPPDLRGKTVYVIDSFSLIFQVFHALPEMTNAKGEPVAAVFGFVKDILSLLENRQPDYLFCAYDMPGPTFRDQLVADYKAHRTEMPVDLAPQLGTIRRILDAMGVPVLGVSGYEADDVLATVARVTTEQGGNCILVTGDKDCRQLLSDQVQIFNIRKNTLFDVAALQADWGVTPEQVVDYQALVGDSVDNIKGVPGIGKKTAPELLQHYGSLDALLAAADKIEKKKLRENLIAGREQALLSRELARLNVHTPLNIPWSGGAKANLHPGGAVEHFRECGFRTLAAKWATAPAERLLLTPQETPLEIVTDPLALVAAVEKIRRAGTFSVQVILSHRYARWAEIIGCAILTADNIGYYFALRGDNSDALDPVEALAALRSLFEDEKILKSGHDLKATVIALKNQGIALRGIAFDTLLAGYLLDAGERGHSLAELAKRHLDETAPEDPSPSKALAARFAQVPLAILARYAIETTALIRRLQPILSERMDQAGLTPLFSDVEMPLLEILAELEFLGMKIDVDRLEILSSNYRIRLEELEREIHQDAGGAFNIASPKQLADVLFTRLKLPVVKKTKTGPSTDAEVLEELAKLHPLPARIVEYRQFAKLKNTYVDALPQLVHPVTRRVHASLNQAVAATGRLSGSDPNLQNIPVRTHSGREIRAAFLPGVAGWQLLAADYSQIELRVLAHFSQDAALLAAFARDEDIHTRVASEVFGVAPEGVDADMRRTAKAVNFGVIYGQSPFGLAKALGISQEEAARFIDAYFNGYAGVERFLTQLLADCFRDGFVSTLLGRRRAIRGIRQPDPLAAGAASRNRNLPEREAINTVIQGSAADLIKLAMIHIERRLRRENRQAKLLLQIHDELILEVPPDELPAVGRLVAEEMAQAYPLSVPLKVDLKSGANWAECEPWT